MKKSFLLSLISGILASGISSCSKSVISNDPDQVEQKTETRTLNIRVSTTDFTRAGEADDIQTLYLAFYKNTNPLYLKEATIGDNGNYTVEITVDQSNIPDRVIAFANITDENMMNNAVATNPTITDLQSNSEGCFIMSSAVYFENNEATGNPVNSSKVTSENIYGGSPIDIYLDRLAAKVTVNKSSDGTNITGPSVTIGEEEATLTLEILSWGLTATDKSSYLLKQVSEASSDLGWAINENKNHSLSWAESVNYNKFSETPDINKITLKSANTDFSTSIYAHESTRHSADLENIDSKPSIIIVGQYKNGDTDMGTFYRLRSGEKNTIFTEAKLWNKIADDQDFLFIKQSENITKANLPDIQKSLELSTPTIKGKTIPDYSVTPQVKSEITEIPFCNSKGDAYEKTTLNTMLYNRYRLFEKYNEGKCIFIVPIEHHKDKNIYGIVRNHSYTLTIKSIAGFGRGIANNNSEISDETIPELESTYTINSTLHVNEWSNIDQEIEIPASK